MHFCVPSFAVVYVRHGYIFLCCVLYIFMYLRLLLCTFVTYVCLCCVSYILTMLHKTFILNGDSFFGHQELQEQKKKSGVAVSVHTAIGSKVKRL